MKLLSQDTFIPTFGGNRDLDPTEQISLSFKALTVADALEAQQQNEINLFMGVEADMNDPASMTRYWKLILHVVENYTSDYKNIELDGKPLTTGAEVAAALRTSDLALLVEIFNHVFTQSLETDEDIKNFKSVSVPTSADADTTVEAA